MDSVRYRKHPRVYHKMQAEEAENENSISISGMAAMGILAGVFIKGVFWGYILRKSMRR